VVPTLMQVPITLLEPPKTSVHDVTRKDLAHTRFSIKGLAGRMMSASRWSRQAVSLLWETQFQSEPTSTPKRVHMHPEHLLGPPAAAPWWCQTTSQDTSFEILAQPLSQGLHDHLLSLHLHHRSLPSLPPPPPPPLSLLPRSLGEQRRYAPPPSPPPEATAKSNETNHSQIFLEVNERQCVKRMVCCACVPVSCFCIY
jgi:hypothetical protein